MIFPHFPAQRWKNRERQCILGGVNQFFTVKQQEIF